jgi:hypothetical protein
MNLKHCARRDPALGCQDAISRALNLLEWLMPITSDRLNAFVDCTQLKELRLLGGAHLRHISMFPRNEYNFGQAVRGLR